MHSYSCSLSYKERNDELKRKNKVGIIWVTYLPTYPLRSQIKTKENLKYFQSYIHSITELSFYPFLFYTPFLLQKWWAVPKAVLEVQEIKTQAWEWEFQMECTQVTCHLVSSWTPWCNKLLSRNKSSRCSCCNVPKWLKKPTEHWRRKRRLQSHVIYSSQQ